MVACSPSKQHRLKPGRETRRTCTAGPCSQTLWSVRRCLRAGQCLPSRVLPARSTYCHYHEHTHTQHVNHQQSGSGSRKMRPPPPPQHHTTTVLWPYSRDRPGELVPEQNFWTSWCKRRLTEADTPTIRLGTTPSGLTSAHLHSSPIFVQTRCPSCRPTKSVKALKATSAFGLGRRC